jgi:hypothetical protein
VRIKDSENIFRGELQEKEHEIQILKTQMSYIQRSQLKIIELLNNPIMVHRIRTSPQDIIAAANAADNDTAAQIEYDHLVPEKQPTAPT